MAIIGYTQILYNVLYGLNTRYFDAGRPRVNVVVISVRYWTIRLGTLQITILDTICNYSLLIHILT